MRKPVRHSRGSGGVELPGRPQGRTQFFEHAVPEHQSDRAGLEGMSEVLSGFFGMASKSVSNLQEAAHEGELRRIEKENEAQARKATTDFFRGDDMDPDLANDLDYVERFEALQADKVGADAERAFLEAYQTDFLANNPHGDFVEFRNQWVQENLTGFENERVEGLALSRFYHNTEQLLGTHTETRLRMVREQGLQDLSSVIAADTAKGLVTPERLAYFMESARALDPANPLEAGPRVAAAMMQAVRGNPEQTQATIQLLTQPGTGINGKSFAESFPTAFNDFQSDALTHNLQTNTMAEYEYFRGIGEQLSDPSKISQDDLFQLGIDIEVGRNQYGASAQADKLRAQLAKEIDRRAGIISNVENVQAMVDGSIAMDGSFVRKNWQDYMAAVHGTRDFLSLEPSKAGYILSGLGGVIPPSVQDQMNKAVVSFENPAAQAKAFQILDVVSHNRSPEFANDFLNDEGARWYEHVQDELSMTDKPLSEAIQSVNEIRQNPGLEDVGWGDLFAESDTDAQETLRTTVSETVNAELGRNGWLRFLLPFHDTNDVRIAPGTRKQIEDYALQVARRRGENGISPEAAIQEATKRVLTRAEVIPQADGTLHLSMDRKRNSVVQEGEDIARRTRMGFAVPAPSGEVVNTVEVYTKELSALQASPLGLLDPDTDVHLMDSPLAQKSGSYLVGQGGGRLVYEPGQVIDVSTLTQPTGTQGDQPGQPGFAAPEADRTTHLAFPGPDQVENLEAQFGEHLPDGFGFVWDSAAEGWALAYKPNFGDQAGQTLEEREVAFENPEAPVEINEENR